MFERILTINLPEKQSIFFWGARQTGKSSYLRKMFKDSIYYDLLDSGELSRFMRSPHLLRQEILASSKEKLKHPVIIDEVQKVPELLNEVHWLIENSAAKFILCGSSARKLKTRSTNLLGGRAWEYDFFPLVFTEIPDFDLLRALKQGLIPRHYLSEKKYVAEHHRAYVDLYLRDEIRNEGLVRNLQTFSRFLEVAGMGNTEMINAANIGRDCGVSSATVKGYYQILMDTLLGYSIYPYNKKIKRDVVTATPKFYFFDVGIANFLAGQAVDTLKGALAGKALESYIAMELMAYRGISRKQFDIFYWRTKTGLEVDFILGRAQVAVEVKISTQVHQQDLKGLIAFCEENPTVEPIVVSQDVRERRLVVNETLVIRIVPWKVFLVELWGNEVI
jgi:predicted AAA+ superfamily ATPase